MDFQETYNYDVTIATSPTPQKYRIGWIDNHKDHAKLAKSSKAETIIIGDSIRITIVEVRGDKVRIGIDAPKDVAVHRQEVYDAIKREVEEADS